MMSQRPEVRKLIPVTADDLKGGRSGKARRPDGPRAAVEFERRRPKPCSSHLLPKYLEFTIFCGDARDRRGLLSPPNS